MVDTLTSAAPPATDAELRLNLNAGTFRDKLFGCWVGKNCGGTLGTPIEEAWGRDEPFDIWWYPELQEGGLPNDDLEMQLVWLTALEQVGPNLTARDLARYWLDHIGYNFDEYGLSKTNLRLGLTPPVSGAFNNWFVDCMGSPIRSEIWACVAPGLPRLAAQYAYEDAICDHAGGESVYGELFNVAIQSSAFVIDDKRKLVEIGLSYVPRDSQTARAVRAALDAIDDGLDWKAARQRVLAATPHYVAQYSPINMGFQVIGFLLGRDFGEALCITVNCGYDTDSSGGSIGSWWGIVEGDAALPAKWTEPFGDAISTNESWGGVRHLTDGSTPIPVTLPDVVERLVHAAHTVTVARAGIDGDIVAVSEESLWADDSVRELWSRDPLTVQFAETEQVTAVRYDGSPSVAAQTTARVFTIITNPHPDAVAGVASVLVPSGWTAPDPQRFEIAAASSTELSWSIAVPTRALLRNSNRLFVDVRLDGYPQEPATPVVLIGHTAMRVGPFVPADGEADEAAILAGAELGDAGGDRSGDDTADDASDLDRAGWQTVSAPGNAIPAHALPAAGGTRVVQMFLTAPRAMTAHLGVDSSGPVRAALNGRDILSFVSRRPIRPSYVGFEDAYLDVKLNEGPNELLLVFARAADAPPTECHVVLSTADRLHNGLPDVERTSFPWDHR